MTGRGSSPIFQFFLPARIGAPFFSTGKPLTLTTPF